MKCSGLDRNPQPRHLPPEIGGSRDKTNKRYKWNTPNYRALSRPDRSTHARRGAGMLWRGEPRGLPTRLQLDGFIVSCTLMDSYLLPVLLTTHARARRQIYSAELELPTSIYREPLEVEVCSPRERVRITLNRTNASSREWKHRCTLKLKSYTNRHGIDGGRLADCLRATPFAMVSAGR